MRSHLGCLRNNGGVNVTDLPAFALHLLEHVPQQYPTVGALEGRIGVREVLADIAKRRGAEQCVAQSMQHHVAIRMREQPELVRDPHPTEGDEIALTETMHVIAMADTHSHLHLEKISRRFYRTAADVEAAAVRTPADQRSR